MEKMDENGLVKQMYGGVLDWQPKRTKLIALVKEYLKEKDIYLALVSERNGS